MVHYKYTYFNLRGLGESVRYIFHYAGVDFEDDRIQMDDWMKHKSMRRVSRYNWFCLKPKIHIVT
uniref:GST N-terminal domain-containing protein n=1 Tax=Romanomermis culicivorax TaxID=13658 RepID=A0A915JBT9_ROMCU